jgi:hypothetical protein
LASRKISPISGERIGSDMHLSTRMGAGASCLRRDRLNHREKFRMQPRAARCRDARVAMQARSRECANARGANGVGRWPRTCVSRAARPMRAASI